MLVAAMRGLNERRSAIPFENSAVINEVRQWLAEADSTSGNSAEPELRLVTK